MTQSFLAHLFASKEVGGKKTKTSRCFSSSYPLIYLIMCRKWTHITDVLEELGSRYCLGVLITEEDTRSQPHKLPAWFGLLLVGDLGSCSSCLLVFGGEATGSSSGSQQSKLCIHDLQQHKLCAAAAGATGSTVHCSGFSAEQQLYASCV